ncbi:unnamed protein product [Rotaria sp. Silwood1]|nr:unnamed protein product [Rotaria sp. Silwood1]
MGCDCRSPINCYDDETRYKTMFVFHTIDMIFFIIRLSLVSNDISKGTSDTKSFLIPILLFDLIASVPIIICDIIYVVMRHCVQPLVRGHSSSPCLWNFGTMTCIRIDCHHERPQTILLMRVIFIICSFILRFICFVIGASCSARFKSQCTAYTVIAAFALVSSIIVIITEFVHFFRLWTYNPTDTRNTSNTNSVYSTDSRRRIEKTHRHHLGFIHYSLLNDQNADKFRDSRCEKTYSKIHALHPYLEEQHLRFTIKILNILYTYRKDYQPYFIYWLLPFQLSYNNNENKNEELYIIAMHFNLFIHHCFLQWSNIYTIANEIMIDLSTNDQEFYEHLKSISNIRKKNINPKDFFKEIISLENISNNNSIQYTNDLISDPVIFLRKWISQMFVGIINCHSVLYLWDQFFMIKWNIIYIKYATITILYLLRNRFMYAKDYNDMRKIFLDEPYLLHTLDIQRAFIHLAIKNYNPKYISDMNQRLYISKSLNNIRYLTNKQKTYL